MAASESIRRASQSTLITARGLSKRYVQRSPFSGKKFVLDALIDVDFSLSASTVTALVGGSGSGKSTLARALALLEKPDRGEIWLEGRDLCRLRRRERAQIRPRIQMVFQDSASSLNPRLPCAQIVAEPLDIQGRLSGTALRRHACELMEEVGLSPAWADRHPLEFSGGQRQRLAIARAIALQPVFLILDESLSGLDLSTQAQILNLLLDLQAKHSLSYLLISHDLSLVGQVADFVAVMHQGRLVEQGSREEVFSTPRHAQTRALLGSVRPLQPAFRTARAGAAQ